ncbi:MAG: glycerol-3-phosphate 1-O-acyltransferase PlsY [Clostridia bacterium]|nr:glycerol-3-phosphate 1-O-acyltransferase PlsY [Clostridia bacterium]
MQEMMQHIINDLTSINIFYFIVMAALGYLIGSLNLSIVLSKSKGKDIREMGSGNAGTTNTLRTMGKGAAAMVLLFDVLKGCLIPLILIWAGPKAWMPINVDTCKAMAYIYAFMAVVGHCFPLYYGFRGGKGIATAAGALLVISPLATGIALVEFVLLMVLFRYVSLSSIVAVMNITVFTALLYPGEARLLAITIAIAVLAIYKHRTNIVRLRNGEESTMFYKKK